MTTPRWRWFATRTPRRSNWSTTWPARSTSSSTGSSSASAPADRRTTPSTTTTTNRKTTLREASTRRPTPPRPAGSSFPFVHRSFRADVVFSLVFTINISGLETLSTPSVHEDPRRWAVAAVGFSVLLLNPSTRFATIAVHHVGRASRPTRFPRLE